MSTLAQALSLAGTRQSGAPVRTQNGKISNCLLNTDFFYHMFRDFAENGLKPAEMCADQ